MNLNMICFNPNVQSIVNLIMYLQYFNQILTVVLEVLDDSDSSIREHALSLIVEMLKNQVLTSFLCHFSLDYTLAHISVCNCTYAPPLVGFFGDKIRERIAISSEKKKANKLLTPIHSKDAICQTYQLIQF